MCKHLDHDNGRQGAERMAAKKHLASLLREADVEIGGPRPWDMRVLDDRLYARLFAGGSLAAGEAYMDGWWEVDQLDEFFARIQRARLDRRLHSIPFLWRAVLSKVSNLQSRRRSRRVAQQHYDLSNDLYAAMLGPTMQYTCAYYGAEGAELTLDEAQRLKLELIARKLYLEPGMTVLELGGGFGELARYLAERYQCRVVSYTISRAQV